MKKKTTLSYQKKQGHIVTILGSTFIDQGVNNYIINNALCWKKFGYRVTIICQDRSAKYFPFVDSYIQGDFPENAPKLKSGQIRIVVPNINNLIPIYKMNQHVQYQGGVSSKLVQQMTQQQIQTNINMTVPCLKAVCLHDRPIKVLAKYVLLSGTVCARALKQLNIQYDIVVLGAALTYSVRPFPHLWKWVFESFKNVDTIYIRTQFVKEQFFKCFKNYVEQYKLNELVKVIEPGMNPQPIQIPQSYFKCQELLLQSIKNKNLLQIPQHQKQNTRIFPQNLDAQQLHQYFIKNAKKSKINERQQDLLQKWLKYRQQDQTIIYLGSLIKNRGIGELLAIAPKIIKQRPTLKFIFCGTGPYKQHMLHLLDSFEQGNLRKAKLIAEAGQFITQINIQQYFIKIDKSIRQRIIFTGLLQNSQIYNLLPLCTIYISPSRTLESWCMKVIEAMCFGLTPICNDHSWSTQVLNAIEKQYPSLTSIIRKDRDQFYNYLPQTIINTLNFIQNNGMNKNKYREKIREIAINNFSFKHTSQVLVRIDSNCGESSSQHTTQQKI